MMAKIFFIVILSAPLLWCQYNGKRFSIGVNAVYTTSSKMYLSPNSSDLTVKNRFSELGDIINPAIEFKYRLTEDIIFGFGTEYIRKVITTQDLPAFAGIEVEDGFSMIPFELSIYYFIPFSTEKFKFLMGGGMGYYLGEHFREIGDVQVSNAERNTAFGIHVIIAMDYLIREFISIHGEMKFRDPQFNVTSRYSKNATIVNNRIILIPQETFSSKVNMDGITFIIGAAFQL